METNQIPVEQPIVTTPAPIVPETVSQAYIPVTQKSSNLPIIILSIFLVISLSAIAYLYTQIQSLKTQAPTPVAQVTPSPVVTPVATSTPAAASAADPTATWTTYTNSTFGFSFQLPKEVSYKYDDLDKYVETGINNAQLLVQNFDGMKAGGDGDSDFQIMILIENSNGLNMEDISSPKKTTISNTSATQGSTTIKWAKSLVTIFDVQPHKIAVVLSSKQSNQNIVLYKQILSTFKFTN